MIKTICDRCGKGIKLNGKNSHFVIHSFDLCPECFREYNILLEDFIYNKNQTTGVRK